MKAVITGGTGFVGRHLVWRMAAKGWQVVFTGRNRAAAEQVQALSPAQVQWLPLDHGLHEAQQQLTQAAQGATAMVHCAALSAPWGQADDFHRANLVSTQEVVKACESQGVARLVHLSTPSLYFDYQDRLQVRETDPLPPPVNLYAQTKAEAEQCVRASSLPERVILRPRAIFGPWDNTLMPRVERVLARGPMPLMRGGQAVLDLTYIDNLIDGIELALTQPLRRPLSLYNLSNGEPIQFTELLASVAKHFDWQLRTRALPWPLVRQIARVLEWQARRTQGPEPLITEYGAGVLAFSQTLDLTAIRQELGYQPRISLQQGMAEHAAWWRQQQEQS